METKRITFRDYFFSASLIVLIIVLIFISYNRFIVKHDYLVGYEGACDPTTESCFIGCEDDACTEEYYYTEMQKYAPDLYAECGKDITDCEVASVCFPEDRECSVTYCDPEIDGDDVCTNVEDFSVSDENEEEPLEDNEMNKNI